MEGEGGARKKQPSPCPSQPLPSQSNCQNFESLSVPNKVSRSTSPFSFGRSRKQWGKKLEKQSQIPDEFLNATSPLSIAPGGYHASCPRERSSSSSNKDRFAEFRRKSKASASSLKGKENIQGFLPKRGNVLSISLFFIDMIMNKRVNKSYKW